MVKVYLRSLTVSLPRMLFYDTVDSKHFLDTYVKLLVRSDSYIQFEGANCTEISERGSIN